MRSRIMLGCLWMLCIKASAQETEHIPSGPIRWSQNGSVEIMPQRLAQTYGSNDSNSARYRPSPTSTAAIGGNPNVTYFRTAKALCENDNSMQFSWVAVQQNDADRYQVEQSSDGRNWTSIGEVPASRYRTGEAPYTFQYNKNVRDGQFRITATTIGGERIFSQVLQAPCSDVAMLGLTQNPVYSSTSLRIGTPVATKVKLAMVTAQGSVIWARDASLAAGANQVPIDMGALPRGSYTLVISWQNGRQDALEVSKQ